MIYDKTISDGYILSISTADRNGIGGIAKEEYEKILAVVQNKPTPPVGFDYRLKTDLTWELYELPVIEEELTAEEALAELVEVLQ